MNTFDWKYHSGFVTAKRAERHYKCQNTGAFKCVESKGDSRMNKSKVIGESFSLPNSDDYDIGSEIELRKLLNIYSVGN